MLDRKVTKEGTMILRAGTFYFGHDWEIDGPVMCREKVILACLHTAQRLMREAQKIIAEAGSGETVNDLPSLSTLGAIAFDSEHTPGFDDPTEAKP